MSENQIKSDFDLVIRASVRPCMKKRHTLQLLICTLYSHLFGATHVYPMFPIISRSFALLERKSIIDPDRERSILCRGSRATLIIDQLDCYLMALKNMRMGDRTRGSVS